MSAGPNSSVGFAKMTGEQRDLLNVGALRVRCEVANLHVLEHAMAKWRHGQLLCGVRRATGAIHRPREAELSEEPTEYRQQRKVAGS